MQAVKTTPKLVSFLAAITAFQAIDLYEYLKTLQASNKSITPTVSKWIYKNCKKLNAVLEKHQPKENAVVDEYAEKTEKGHIMFWDGYDEEIKQNVGGVDKVVFGARAYLDKATKTLKYVSDDKIVPRQQAQMYAPFVKDVVKRAEYLEKKVAINDTLYNVQLEKIDGAIIEGLALPSPETNPNSKYEILDLVYENLINVLDDDSMEVTEVVKEEVPAAETSETSETNSETTESGEKEKGGINVSAYKAEPAVEEGEKKSNLEVVK